MAKTPNALCLSCTALVEICELRKLIKDRLFDASNEGENTLEGLEVSFNKDDNWKNRS
jgi:hypothetical protein